uniref:CSON010543 protein n=1 Tax=Culicoides sonorensis TaxID=179676 RepID=A0A336LQP5_CULSO
MSDYDSSEELAKKTIDDINDVLNSTYDGVPVRERFGNYSNQFNERPLLNNLRMMADLHPHDNFPASVYRQPRMQSETGNSSNSMYVEDDFGLDRYDMDRYQNGYAIILNFEHFQDPSRFRTRTGTQADVDRLIKVFKKLNIKINNIHQDLTKNQMEQKLRQFRSMKYDLSNSNALIVVILSHGLEGDNIMATDSAFHLHDIIRMFNTEELPEMAGRPKIFIIQACRGNQVDRGTQLNHYNDHVDADEDDLHPNYADFCIAMSSHHGHKSFRNEQTGSWFIQAFCDILETIDLENNHLLDILTATKRKVAARTSKSGKLETNNKKQISSCYMTLTKKFYFKKN